MNGAGQCMKVKYNDYAYMYIYACGTINVHVLAHITFAYGYGFPHFNFNPVFEFSCNNKATLVCNSGASLHLYTCTALSGMLSILWRAISDCEV